MARGICHSCQQRRGDRWPHNCRDSGSRGSNIVFAALAIAGSEFTLSMITIMIGSNLVLLPQDVTLLGVELIVFNLACACLLPGPVIVNELRKHEDLSIRVPVLAVFFYLLAAAGGASLIVHWGGGLYLPMAAYSAYLLSAVATAYALLMPHRKASKR